MANIKISQLNQATAYTLNDVVAIVDSGSTETKKINIQDLFSSINSTRTESNNNNMILASRDTELLDRSPASSTGSQGNNAIIASANSALRSNANDGCNFILGTKDSTIDVESEGAFNSIISSYGQNQITRGYAASIISSNGCLTQDYNENLSIIGSTNITAQNLFNTTIMSSQGYVVNNCRRSALIGVEGGSMNNVNNFVLLGGYIANATNVSGEFFFGASFNDLTFDTGGNFRKGLSAISTDGCQVENEWSSLIAASGKTTLYDYTLHTENLHAYGTISRDVAAGGNVSGTTSVDLSNNSIFTFSITGNLTSVDFTNWREGGIYTFFVENTGSFTISTMTISGGGSVYAKGGSFNPTSNGFTKYTGIVINGNMILNEELDFQVV
jgi:hypothetical protein